MSRRPVIKVARKGKDLNGIAPKDLSFSSEWKTPKIFMQTDTSQDLSLGFTPSFMGFRQLNDSIINPTSGITYEYEPAGFTTDDFTFSLSSTQNSDSGITVTDTGVSVEKYSGTFGGHSWEDENAFALLFFDPLEGTVPSEYQIGNGVVLLSAQEGMDVYNHPYNLTVDSRFDSFKIAHTGTLSLSIASETIGMGEDPSIYTTSFAHNLGYPPVYLPEVGTGWIIDHTENSFIVNDRLGTLPSPISGPILDVWVDSSKLYLQLTRFSASDWDRYYGSQSITMYYTVFYNQIGEEFNLLS